MPEPFLVLAINQCAALLNCSDAMLYVWDDVRQRFVARAATAEHRTYELAIELALGDGVVGWSALNKEPVVLDDAPTQDVRFRLVPDVDDLGHRSFLAVPLVDTDNTVQAVIVARHMEPGRFSDADVTAIQAVGELILHTVSSGLSTQAQVQQDDQTKAIRAIGDAASSETLQSHEALNIIASKLAQATSSDLVVIVSAQISNRPYLDARGIGIRQHANLASIQLSQIPAGAVAAATGARRWLNQDEAPELFAALGNRSTRPMQSVLATPMRSRGLVLGTILTFHREGTTPRSQHPVPQQGLVDQAALAIAVIDLTTDPDERRTERRLLELLFSGSEPSSLMRRLANEVSFDLEAGHVVAYGRLGADTPGQGAQVQIQTLERVIRQSLPGALCDPQMHGVRSVVPLRGQTPQEIAVLLHTALETRPGAKVGFIGVSDPVGPTSRHWPALQEATLASRLCSKVGTVVRSLSISNAGASAYLLPLVDSTPPGLLEQMLIDLHHRDQSEGTELFHTLECFLTNGCRPTATAKELHLHRNSLTARLKSASRLLNGMTLDESNRLSLEIALHMVRLRLT